MLNTEKIILNAYKVTIERRNETKIEFSHIVELG